MDSELLMKSLNPELYQLMVRVKAIHAICGGDTGIKVRARRALRLPAARADNDVASRPARRQAE